MPPTYFPNFPITYLAHNITIILARDKLIVDEIFRWATSSEVAFQIGSVGAFNCAVDFTYKTFSPWKRVCPPVTLNPVSNYRHHCHCHYRHCRRRRLRMLLFRRPGAGYDQVTKSIWKNHWFSFSVVHDIFLYKGWLKIELVESLNFSWFWPSCIPSSSLNFS